MLHTQTFRFFISSTFKDFQLERQRLHERVFPAIDKYLKDNYPQYTFQAIDLRWGVTEEAQYNQQAINICLNEIETCQKYLKPNFFIMIGNRYGWIPLPYTIEKDEFREILSQLNKSERDYLSKWYSIDTNHIPISYILQTRTKNYQDWNIWEIEEKKIQEILLKAVNKIDNKSIDKIKYSTSATELEVYKGIQDYKNQIVVEKDNIFGFIRNILNSDNDEYIDKDQNKVISFKENLKKSKIILEQKDISLLNNQTFKNESIYLDYFENFITNALQNSISKQIKEHQFFLSQGIEKMEQLYFQKQRIEIFEGRKDELEILYNYLENKENRQPFMIYGASGIGKSAFLAKIIDKFQNKKELIYRFIGVSANTSNTEILLKSIIDELIDKNLIREPSYYEQEPHLFYQQVYKLLQTIKKPTTIILDAIDQLQTKEELIWLPIQLPKHLKIIISVINERDRYYFDTIKKNIDIKNQLQLKALSNIDIKNILEKLLKNAKRDLTTSQKEYVLKQINRSNNSPLYIRIIFETIKHWHSFDNETLEIGIESAIIEYVKNLKEKFYNYPDVVDKIFGLILASKDGLSEKEIIEILSRDKKLIKSLEKLHSLNLNIDGKNVSKFPTSIWVRLYEPIKPFLMTRLINGQELFTFFHREFNKVIGKIIYNSNKTTLHKELSNYFISFEEPNKLWDKRYPIRMLTELPYHLVEIEDIDSLKSLILNFEFIGTIYDNNKQEEFYQIIFQSKLLQEEFNIWISFFREYEALITEINNSHWKSHQTLFQLAYEDGLNSIIHNEALKLIEAQRVDWNWIRKVKIKDKLERKVLYSYYLKKDNLPIKSYFNSIILDNNIIFYYDKDIYIFNKKLEYIQSENIKSENSLAYFKTVKNNNILFVIFNTVIILINNHKIEIVYMDMVFPKKYKNQINKLIFYKNEIFYFLGVSKIDSKSAYDRDRLKEYKDYNFIVNRDENMYIDNRFIQIYHIMVIDSDLEITKLADISNLKKSIAIFNIDKNAIYYIQDDIYYKYDKKSKTYKEDNNYKKDNINSSLIYYDYYIKEYDEDSFGEDYLEKASYDASFEENFISDVERNRLYTPNYNILGGTVTLTSGEHCIKIDSHHYNNYSYEIDNRHYITLNSQYITIGEKLNLNKIPTYQNMEYINKFFSKSNQKTNNIFWIDYNKFIIYKDNIFKIISDDKTIYTSKELISDFYLYDNSLVMLSQNKEMIIYIDITQWQELNPLTIRIDKINNIKWNKKDIIQNIIISTSGKIGICYSTHISDRDYYDDYDDSYTKYIVAMIEINNNIFNYIDNIDLGWHEYDAYENNEENTLFAIDDLAKEPLIYHIVRSYVDYEDYGDDYDYNKVWFEQNNISGYFKDKLKKSNYFNINSYEFYSKLRISISYIDNSLKVFDNSNFTSISWSREFLKVEKDEDLLYYIGGAENIKCFGDKIAIYNDKNIEFIEYIPKQVL